MRHLMSLVLLLPYAAGRLLPPPRYPLYASASGEEYEPYAVATLPLHAPLPLLQLVSPAPRARPRRPARRPRPDQELYALEASQPQRAYEPVRYEAVYEPYEEYEESYEADTKHKARDQYEDEASSVVVYARPNKHGGFSYRKPAVPTPAPPRLLPETREPVIIRIHKYRVIH
ncbi:uncharacterized protein LOC112056097 [Bicyclus anynana]|uniref:Uncharacterized protein LOC112056097 n=1 Tax=Bicyclus anynana TaxID=110368 RepID=A0A6J1P3F5_BICAN|nr:uncharacterized protein LOC112056097 [Bicyclus anynana]